MTAKRYFKRMWEEEYYIFDSNTISESDFEEKLEYQNYKAFEDSMMGDEVVNRLNEQHETIERLNQQLRIYSDGLKAEIRETKEVFEDYSECVDEKKQLKQENEQLKTTIQQLTNDNTKQKKKLNTTMKENEQLKIALKDKENIIKICEKKFKELGYLITCDDNGYVIE